MSAPIVLLLILGIFILVGLLIFLIFGLNPLIRHTIKSTGIPGTAKILECRFGKWVVYSGSEYNHSVSSQQVILKLEVHPSDGTLAYIAEDKFMAKAIDVMRLIPGCELQVYISRNNPQKVVCDPKTVRASHNAPAQAGIGLAMADIAQRAIQGESVSPDQVMDMLRSQGIQTSPPPLVVDDTRSKLEQLKAMLSEGLITQEEFEAKKKDILSRM